jgi:hypothetical protein
MRPRLRGFWIALVLTVPLAAEATACGAEASTAAAPSGGIRTDLLARRELETWRAIVAIVMAEGPNGQPLHPTLRALWDSVASSGHTVYIQMRDRKARSHIAGRFTITRVDPSGESHEAVLTLNLRTIDAAPTGPAGRRASGFTPFEGLGRTERYAEVLGHELAHAVSSLADIAQAQLAVRRNGEVQEHLRLLREGWARRSPAEALERAQELGRLIQLSEEPAEAVEMIIWQELRAGSRKARFGNEPRRQAEKQQEP